LKLLMRNLLLTKFLRTEKKPWVATTFLLRKAQQVI